VIARRVILPTRMNVGPYRLATLHQRRGYVVVDDRTGRIAYTQAHPISGRPVMCWEPNVRRALQIAGMMAAG